MNIVVTGASSGIGRATVLHLDSLGHRVIMVARREDALRDLVLRMKNTPLYFPYDLQNLENIESIFTYCKQEGIKLDGLVHCAGINRDMPIKVNDISAMMEVMRLNYMSFVELGKFFSLKKYTNDGAAMVALSSCAVYDCAKSMCTYTASKAAIDTTVRIMAREFAKRKIRVNSIQPAFVDTEMARSVDNLEAKVANQPLGFIEPVQVAYLIEFLLSDKAKYISGSNIKISAGVL